MRKRYILLKETPAYHAGAIFEEECDDGTPDFICINHREFTTVEDHDHDNWSYARSIIISQPEWFDQIMPLYVPVKNIKKIEKFLKDLK